MFLNTLPVVRFFSMLHVVPELPASIFTPERLSLPSGIIINSITVIESRARNGIFHSPIKFRRHAQSLPRRRRAPVPYKNSYSHAYKFPVQFFCICQCIFPSKPLHIHAPSPVCTRYLHSLFFKKHLLKIKRLKRTRPG